MTSGDTATYTGRSDNSGRTPNPAFSNECPITGVVNRVKIPDKNERQAILYDPSITTVMLSIDCVARLVNQHEETAGTYFRDDQTVITTTTTHDTTLQALDWNEELELVRRFGPDFHIPTEYSVYQTMSISQQIQATDDCMKGTEWMFDRLKNHSIQILFQAKGWRSWHFRMCRSTMKRLETDFVVFYATGYKGRIYELLDDLSNLISELNPSGILIIGKQSVRFLDKAPPEVVAAAGGRWRWQSELIGAGHMQKKHELWKKRVETQLACGQSLLDSYN